MLSARALIGSIKGQIDCTYQCSHCFTWCGSYVVHVCLITRVLTGPNWSNSPSHYACLRKGPCINSALFLLFATEIQRFRKRFASQPFPKNSKQGKWVIKSKPQANRSIIYSHFVLMNKHNTVIAVTPETHQKGTLTYCLSSVRHCIIYTR